MTFWASLLKRFNHFRFVCVTAVFKSLLTASHISGWQRTRHCRESCTNSCRKRVVYLVNGHILTGISEISARLYRVYLKSGRHNCPISITWHCAADSYCKITTKAALAILYHWVDCRSGTPPIVKSTREYCPVVALIPFTLYLPPTQWRSTCQMYDCQSVKTNLFWRRWSFYTIQPTISWRLNYHHFRKREWSRGTSNSSLEICPIYSMVWLVPPKSCTMSEC